MLRALGATPPTLAADALMGVVGAVAAGSVLAVLVAVALSPLSPLGPVRPFYPTPGISFDWTVLGGGFGALFIGLALAAGGLARRHSPQRAARRRRLAVNSSTLVRGDVLLGLPAPGGDGPAICPQPRQRGRHRADATGDRGRRPGGDGTDLHYHLRGQLGPSRLDPPAVRVELELRPLRWGGRGGGDIPAHQATTMLAHDHYLSAWSAVYFSSVIIDGQEVAAMSVTPGALVQPPLLDGHGLQQPDEVVVGALTLASLHKHVGDTVTVSGGEGAFHRLRIVGVATMPTIGGTGALHLEMGSGAVVATSLIPAVLRNPFNDPETGPNAFLVDVRPGVNPAAAQRSLEEMTGPLSNSYNFGVVVQSVLHPAEIVDYRSMGTTPAILGAALGAGALVALGLTLLASVRRRRQDLAVLKTLGFTRSQLRAVVAWQSNVAVVIGTLVGIPVGIAAGRALWDLFAHEINAVPSPVIPAVPVTLVGLGALVLANAVAAVPGRIAARTPRRCCCARNEPYATFSRSTRPLSMARAAPVSVRISGEMNSRTSGRRHLQRRRRPQDQSAR